MKLTLSLLLVCLSVLACTAGPVAPAPAPVSQRDISAFSTGQAAGNDTVASSYTIEDILGRISAGMAAAKQGSAFSTSNLRIKETNPVLEANPAVQQANPAAQQANPAAQQANPALQEANPPKTAPNVENAKAIVETTAK